MTDKKSLILSKGGGRRRGDSSTFNILSLNFREDGLPTNDVLLVGWIIGSFETTCARKLKNYTETTKQLTKYDMGKPKKITFEDKELFVFIIIMRKMNLFINESN